MDAQATSLKRSVRVVSKDQFKGQWMACFARQVLAGAMTASLFCACASVPPAPLNLPAPLSLADQIGIPGVPRSNVVSMNGEPVPAAGVVVKGEALITIPYRYRHTAVLTEDVTGFSMTVPGVQAPKGAPGFYAGTFVSDDRLSRPLLAKGPSDMWCFLPKLVGGSRDTICLFRNEPGIAAIAPTRLNPWMWETFFPATGSFDYVNTPIFEKREVEIPADLKLEYRFNGWTNTEVEIVEYAVGRAVHRFKLSRDKDGIATLNTLAGRLRVAAAPGNPNNAVATLEPLSKG